MKLQKRHREPVAGVVLVGNHEAMNMTDDLRYVDPREFAAFANANSARLRERVYQDNRGRLWRPTGPVTAMTASAIHKAGWQRIRSASSSISGVEPARRAWAMDDRQPRGRQDRRHRVRHGGITSAMPEPDRRHQSPHGGALTAATVRGLDPLRPIRASMVPGLVTRRPDAAGQALAPSSRLATPPRESSIDDELATVLRSYGARRLVIGHTPNLSGIMISHGARLCGSIPGSRAITAASLAIWRSSAAARCRTTSTLAAAARPGEMVIVRLAMMLAATIVAAAASAQAAPKTLFADNSMLRLTIAGPISRSLSRAGSIASRVTRS